MSRILFSFCIIFYAIFSFTAAKTGCPPEEDIAPCKCFRNPSPRLICNRITTPDDLLEVFRASENYTFEEVHVKNSALLYIPVQIFLNTRVEDLYLTNSAVGQVFVESSDWRKSRNVYNYPYKVEIENTKILRGISSTNFSTLTNLTELFIHSSPVETLSPIFSLSLPASLKTLSFSANGIRFIRNGALSYLPDLDTFSFERNRLKNISRDIFPKPFNARIINFDFNQITSIPNDMFHDMPKLMFLSMQKNLITTIPEGSFNGVGRKLPYFRFDDNPLQCDCEILWIVKAKPAIFTGTCNTPENLNGKAVKDLTLSDFAC